LSGTLSVLTELRVQPAIATNSSVIVRYGFISCHSGITIEVTGGEERSLISGPTAPSPPVHRIVRWRAARPPRHIRRCGPA
jgi:hypothetical protein